MATDALTTRQGAGLRASTGCKPTLRGGLNFMALSSFEMGRSQKSSSMIRKTVAGGRENDGFDRQAGCLSEPAKVVAQPALTSLPSTKNPEVAL